MQKIYGLFWQTEDRPYTHVYGKLAVYFTLIAFALTLSPFHFEIALLKTFSWKHAPFDVFVNLFLLFPVGLFAVLAKRECKSVDILLFLALGLGLSFSIESLQLLIPQRTSQYWDVICNTISVMLGAGVGAVIKPVLNQVGRYHDALHVLLVNILIAVAILLLMYTIYHPADIQMFAVALLLLTCCLISAIFINRALQHETPQHMQAFVCCVVFTTLLTIPLLLNHPFIMLSMILTVALFTFFSTLIGYSGRVGKKIATALSIIICAGFTYLLLAELITMVAGLMPGTADSTADNTVNITVNNTVNNTANSAGESGAAITKHDAVGGSLIMGSMILSILLDGTKLILMKNTNLVSTHNNNLKSVLCNMIE
jgi:glycopeptide antibiotics resistance protein